MSTGDGCCGQVRGWGRSVGVSGRWGSIRSRRGGPQGGWALVVGVGGVENRLGLLVGGGWACLRRTRMPTLPGPWRRGGLWLVGTWKTGRACGRGRVPRREEGFGRRHCRRVRAPDSNSRRVGRARVGRVWAKASRTRTRPSLGGATGLCRVGLWRGWGGPTPAGRARSSLGGATGLCRVGLGRGGPTPAGPSAVELGRGNRSLPGRARARAGQTPPGRARSSLDRGGRTLSRRAWARTEPSRNRSAEPGPSRART